MAQYLSTRAGHLAAMMFIAVQVAALMLILPASAKLTAKQIDYLLQRHNDLRRIVRPSAANMLEMRWDSTLARVAEEYSRRCEWRHNTRRHERFHALGGTRAWRWVGENLAADTIGDLDRMLDRSLTSFFNENKDYHFHTLKCTPGKMCGHYTQMVWADTVSVGCAVHRCPRVSGALSGRSAWYLTCNYGPSGNVNIHNTRPYTHGKSCSKCPRSAQHCNRGLCSSTPPVAAPAVVDPTTPAPTAPAPTTPAPTTPAPTTRPKPVAVGSPKARVHVQGTRFAAGTTGTNTNELTVFWNKQSPQTKLEGFALVSGSLQAQRPGLYFIYSLLWNSVSGQPAEYQVFVDERPVASAKPATGNQFAFTGSYLRLKGGEKISVRLSLPGNKSRFLVWQAKSASWLGARQF